MKCFLLVCHPDPGSFNVSTAQEIRDRVRARGNAVFFHDLYAENFNAVLSLPELERKYSFDPVVQAQMKEVQASNHIVILYPDWWGQPPAVLKGWVDRIMQPGFAYEYEDGFSDSKEVIPLLQGKKVSVGITTDRVKGPLLITDIWEKTLWNFVGIMDVSFEVLYNARRSSVQEREAFVEGMIKRILTSQY